MAQPMVMGDKVQGQCAVHQVPNPASGAPQPSPAPLPFSAPLLTGLEPTVTIGGKAVAVVGSSGINTPPHVGLHVSDLFVVPNLQQGMVMSGSATVMAGGKPIATSMSQVTMCAQVPGMAVGTVTDVTID
jgi:uncharacterized Zn-binding protein involved in type VI secretion